MNDSDDIPPEPEYTADDLQRFAAIIGVPDLSPELAKRLKSAALGYWFLTEVEKDRPTRSEHRKALKRITKSALELKTAMECRAAILFKDQDALPIIEPDTLEGLAKAADEASDRIPKGGANPKNARKFFVEKLGQIYFAATGNRPTLSRKLTSEPTGGFYEFVEAALRPLNPHAIAGLEHDVRKVVKSTSKTPT